MKKIALSFVASSLLTLSYASEATTLQEAFTNGNFKGHIRLFYIDRHWQGSISKKDISAFATGLDLQYETASFKGMSLGVGLYSDSDFGLNHSFSSGKLNTSILGDKGEGYAFVGEAYLKYKIGKTTFKAGRQKLNTPLAAADDARMIPSLFEAYVLTNTDLPDTTLVAAHVTKEAPGTFYNQYRIPTLPALALTAGYGAGYLNPTQTGVVGHFLDMGRYAIGQDTDGVTAAAIIYKGIQNLSLQVWDYYAHDILNALYIQADYKIPLQGSIKPFIAAQYINEQEVGDELAGKVDSNYFAIKAGLVYGALSAYAAYSTTDDSTNAALNGGIITPWGGMPAFTQGMVTRHQFFADTDAWKVAAAYKWNNYGVNLKTAFYYTSFDVGKNNSLATDSTAYAHSWTATEAGFDFIYYPKAVKNLQLRFRGNFPRKFLEKSDGNDLGWNEFRFIINYNF
ncbi:hypothetical protein NitYY0826_C0636 [Nitratiruptor sp. YY08-26]|uniref:OprD family outer membrane porin n=1 Tax=unclassified Nitratiruptor TaxID=2624044 RepID=UPI001915EC55|nr:MULTISPECIES: OprD family outer membrane porin [unclassified Nitratiruptor]BCD61773.1 hypothetical protein NitYY0813_C0634 [Nitratiruptor sp. YY08-13]BCD65708.1 hypothetical protein NitYY0826_C0636 [Nitratiruptor sp. YY08-26]